MNELKYNGKKLSDFGVYYDSFSAYDSPERDVEMVEVAGRNGDLIIDNDRFRNIDLTFPCYAHGGFIQKYRNVLAYLQSCKGYNRLEYSQEPDHFRLASFNMGSQPSPTQKGGQFPLVFNCKPQRFLLSGETPVDSSSQNTTYTGNPVTIQNPSGLSAVSSLSVELNPSQDLHGYESPWVGGAGKNKLPSPSATSKTNNGITIAVDNGVYSISGTATALSEIIFDLPFDVAITADDKCCYLNDSANAGVTFYWRYNYTNGGSMGMESVNRVTTFTTASTYNKIRFLVSSGTAITGTMHLSPVLMNKNNSDESYAPYENICPIYPANGKNLLQNTATSQTVGGITYTVSADGTVTANGTATETSIFPLKSGLLSDILSNGTAYVLSGCPSGGSGTAYELQLRLGASIYANDFGSGAELTYQTSSDTSFSFVRIVVFSGTVCNNLVFKPMIRRADITDSTYVPYLGINVLRTGKNLLDPSLLTVFSQTYVSTVNYNTVGLIAVAPSTAYTISFASGVGDGRIFQYDASGNVIGSALQFMSQPYTFTTNANCKTIGFRYKFTNETATVADAKAQLELGNTATDYEPYQGTTYSSILPSEVYGGTLDLVTGELTVDMAIVDIGTLDWTVNNHATLGQYFYANVRPLGVKYAGSYNTTAYHSLCDSYVVVKRVASEFVNGTYCFDGSVDSVAQVQFKNSAYTTAADFKTAMSGVQFCYELATPTTTTLTPQQVSLLLGTNVLSADSGLTIIVSEPSELINPTLFESKPLIRVYGSGTVIVNDQYITVSANTYEYIDIDCELMDARHGMTNCNSYVSFSTTGFITLKAGSNYIAPSGFTKVEITPRWYEV